MRKRIVKEKAHAACSRRCTSMQSVADARHNHVGKVKDWRLGMPGRWVL
jgi:hypothetical protein